MPAAVRARFDNAIRSRAQVSVSTVVLHELWPGVAKSARPKENAEDLATFLGGLVRVQSFEEQDARKEGAIRASLVRIGRPIEAYDVLVAGQALS